jgi:hypothetical protein
MNLDATDQEALPDSCGSDAREQKLPLILIPAQREVMRK